MRVLPAIDLLDGQVVRLSKGEFSKKTEYSMSPIEAARKWQEAGFSFIHIVSLDGARDGEMKYAEILASIKKLGLGIQFGGGVRSVETVDQLIDAGVDRIMIGTSAIENPSFWHEIAQKYGKERFVLTLDVRGGVVSTKGWTEDTDMTLEDVAERIGKDQIAHMLVTDIVKDGSLEGVNADFYADLKSKFPKINIIPAGGVSSVRDLKQIEQIEIVEVVMGKALYEVPGLLDEIVKEHYV